MEPEMIGEAVEPAVTCSSVFNQLVNWCFNRERSSLLLQGLRAPRRRWRISPFCFETTQTAPPPANSAQLRTFSFHHSQPFTPDLFLQRRYFKPHVERCQRVPVSVPSCLCVPMRQMLISRPGRTVVVSADLYCWLKPCVFLWPCACLLAFLCAGIALPLYSHVDAAVCSLLVLSVPLLFTDC